jgi:hypothetical protein
MVGRPLEALPFPSCMGEGGQMARASNVLILYLENVT